MNKDHSDVVFFPMENLEILTGLKKQSDFSRVYRQGRSKADSLLVLYSLAREEGAEARLGISVSKKVGNSVVRHRIKRRLKEIARLNPGAFPEGRDFILIARVKAAEADYHDLERSVLRLAAKIH